MEFKAVILFIVFNSFSFCTFCPEGQYRAGYKCMSCSSKCMSCKSNGACEGCITGHYGSACFQKCLYNCDDCSDGKTCNKCSQGSYLSAQNTCIRCSANCADRKCSLKDGRCVKGCIDYSYGALCDSVCPSHCKNGSCNQYDGSCTNGCEEGFYGPRCLRLTEHVEESKQTRTITQTTLQHSTYFVENEEPVEKSKTSDESWYLYAVMGVCLLVTVLILVTCVGYIIRSRKKQSKMSEMKNTPSVVYSREYNYIDYSDSTNSIRTQNASYFEPLPDSMYDYISNSIKRDVTVSNNSRDSDGYTKPTNQNRHYITAVYGKNKSTSYELLKHDGTAEHSYNGLQTNKF